MKSAEEIIKGLECCESEDLDSCRGCSYTEWESCSDHLKNDAAELIRRLTGKSDGAVILEKDMVVQKPSPAPESHDPVNHPSHYTQGGVECKDAIRAAVTGLEGYEAFLTGNAIKYLWRWKRKNGAEDLRKAVFWIRELIEETEG